MAAGSQGEVALEDFIERQFARALAGMLSSISTRTVKERPGFGQRIVAKLGSIVASPVPASYDPDPDYFFHWYRDSAAIIEALRQAHRRGAIGEEAIGHLGDFVRFTLELDGLNGASLIADEGWRKRVQPDFEQFVRPPEELAAIAGERVRMETRVNPDGTLDISRWPRPQYDGSAAIALTLMRWLADGSHIDETLRRDIGVLLREELAFTLRHCREACFDIWEEEHAHHYYTLRLSAAALEHGARWLGAGEEAGSCRAAAGELQKRLDGSGCPMREFIARASAPTGSARTVTSTSPSSSRQSMPTGRVRSTRCSTRGSPNSPGLGRRLCDGLSDQCRLACRRRACPRSLSRRCLFRRQSLVCRNAGRRRIRVSSQRARGRRGGSAGGASPGRRLSRDRPMLPAGRRRHAEQFDKAERRAALGQASRLELCRFHHGHLRPHPLAIGGIEPARRDDAAADEGPVARHDAERGEAEQAGKEQLDIGIGCQNRGRGEAIATDQEPMADGGGDTGQDGEARS